MTYTTEEITEANELLKEAKAKATKKPWMLFDSEGLVEIQCESSVAVVNWQGFDDSEAPIEQHRANASYAVDARNTPSEEHIDWLLEQLEESQHRADWLWAEREKAAVHVGMPQGEADEDLASWVSEKVAGLLAEVERLTAYRETAETLIGKLAWQLDELGEHIDKDGNFKGSGEWRKRDVGKAISEMNAAFQEAAKEPA